MFSFAMEISSELADWLAPGVKTCFQAIRSAPPVRAAGRAVFLPSGFRGSQRFF